MTQIAIIYTLVSNAPQAREICEAMLTEKLIACANRLAPTTSHYNWNGKIQSEEEYPIILKTDPAKLSAAMDRLREIHPYDIPAITSWMADAAPDFADWVARETGTAIEAEKPRRPEFRK